MILQIERQWNRDPGWISSLPRPTQIQLIADFRLDHEEPKRRDARSNSAKRARFDMIKERAIKQGSI